MRLHPINDASWSFQTAQFFVGFYAEPEEMDPADSFQFDEDIEAVRSGSVEWFSASIRVYFKDGSDEVSDWHELGSDHLGGCAYKTVREFYTEHRCADPLNRNCSIMRDARGGNVVICHYFPDMVRQTIDAARGELHKLQSVKMRAA